MKTKQTELTVKSSTTYVYWTFHNTAHHFYSTGIIKDIPHIIYSVSVTFSLKIVSLKIFKSADGKCHDDLGKWYARSPPWVERRSYCRRHHSACLLSVRLVLGGMRSKSNGEESSFPFLCLGNEKGGHAGVGVAIRGAGELNAAWKT